jgi:hypothetical protein
MLITSHAAGAIMVVQQEPNGLLYCAKMSYTNERGVSFRHMMETGENGETVVETLRNGILKELAEDEKDFDYQLMQREPVLIKFSRDEHHSGGIHMKTFFAVKHLKGKFRARDLPDGTAKLGPVVVEEIAAFIKVNEGKTAPIHVEASRAALVALAADKAVFEKYEKIIFGYELAPLNAEEQAAIDAYPCKW